MAKLDPKLMAAFMAMLNGQPNVTARKKPAKSGAKKGTKHKKKATEAEVQEAIAKNTALCVEAFEKAGFTDVQPRVNVLTFDKWVEQGFAPRKGEKSTQVGNFRLFHKDQVAPLETTEVTA